jgi:20S proteasome alpha/beta subunit
MEGGTMEAGVRLAYVQVMAHGYQPDETTLETLLNAVDVNGENVRYTFSNPYHNYVITGGTITESGPNFVSITASGTVTERKRNDNGTQADINNTLRSMKKTL